MDTAEASPRYELAGGMESILRSHCEELLLNRDRLLVRMSNQEGLNRWRIGLNIRMVPEASIQEFRGLSVGFPDLIPTEKEFNLRIIS